MLLLENAALADLKEGRLLPGQNILIEDDVIVEVSGRPIKSPNAERLDFDGRCVLPGLIDAHFHATLTEMNPAQWRDLPATLMTARASVLLRKALMRGFTTVRDMGGADWGLKTAVAEGTLIGPRLYIANRGLSQTGGHGDLRSRADHDVPCSCSTAQSFLSIVADGTPAVQAAAREQLRQGADHLKVFVSGGVASPSDPLASSQYTDAELTAVVQEAERWGTYVGAHAYTAAAILRAVAAGVRTIEHGNLLDAKAATSMAAHEAFLVPTWVTYEVLRRKGSATGMSAFSLEKLEAVAAAGPRSVELALAAGVRVGFGTDLLGELHEFQSEELLLRARVQRPCEVLRSATEVNAEILGMRGKLGSIEPGAYADLIAFRGDPLRDLGLLQDQGSNLDVIMKAGVFVKRRL